MADTKAGGSTSAASSPIPPGYTITSAEGRRAWETRLERQLLVFAVLLAAAMVGTVHELVVRQPAAYLGPTRALPPSAVWGVAILAGACGALWGARLRHPDRALPWLTLSAAVAVGASGYLWFAAFVRPWALALVAWGTPLGCGITLGATLAVAFRALWFRATALHVFERAIAPARALGATAALATAVGALTVVGYLRATVALGMTLAALAMWSENLLALAERRPARSWGLRGAALGLIVVGLVAFSHAGRLVTSRELHRFGNVVYTHESPRGRYVVVSAQQAFALFADGKLELSTLDGYRYAEALVHPAMSTARRRQRVAILGGGKGLVEREVLRYPEVERVDVVVSDAALPRIARRTPWRTGALDDDRVTIIEEEPMVWLDMGHSLYDVILVDVPDPIGYGEAKNYTRTFYQRLRARLGSQGVAGIQATSAFRAPRSFASIAETVRASGLAVRPYRAPVPIYGEWGFLLASPSLTDPSHDLAPNLQFLSASILDAMFDGPRDERSTSPAGTVNRLHDLRLLDVFEEETAN